jgi:hypothetical protein
MKLICENCANEVDEVFECEICEQEVCDNCMLHCEKLGLIFCCLGCMDCDNCDYRHNCDKY